MATTPSMERTAAICRFMMISPIASIRSQGIICKYGSAQRRSRRSAASRDGERCGRTAIGRVFSRFKRGDLPYILGRFGEVSESGVVAVMRDGVHRFRIRGGKVVGWRAFENT